MSFLPVQAQTFYLAGSGATLGDETIVLSSLLQIDGETELTMDDFGTKGYATIEPNSAVQEEAISFSGITQNENGTATLTGVKSVLFVSPYTESAGLARSHPGGCKLIITNTAQFYDDMLSFNNDETVTGKFTFPNGANRPQLAADTDTTTDEELVDYGQIYRLSIAGAVNGDLTHKGIFEEATMAEINAGTQAGGTSAELIINPKYLKDSNYYLFLPTTGQKDALAGTSGTPSSTNKYVTNDDAAETGNSKILRLTSGGKITTSTIDTGTGAGQIVILDGSAKLPAVDGSQLTGLFGAFDFLASDTLRQSDNTEKSTMLGTYTKIKEIIVTAGTLTNCRIKFDMNPGGHPETVYGRIYKNGVAIGTEQSLTESGYITFSQDLTTDFTVDDLIQIYAKADNADMGVYVKNLRIYYDYGITTLKGLTLETPIVAASASIPTTTFNNQDP